MMTSLYRHFGKSGELLYIGISLSVVHRLSQHVDSAAWATKIAKVTVEYFPTRQRALDAERNAIMAERPKYNKVHNTANDNRKAPKNIKAQARSMRSGRLGIDDLVLLIGNRIAASGDAGTNKRLLFMSLSADGYKASSGMLSDAIMQMIQIGTIEACDERGNYVWVDAYAARRKRRK